MTGLVWLSAYAFGAVDGFSAIFAVTKLSGSLVDIGVKLVEVVEGRYHDVSALFAFGVVAEMPHDPALNAVVVGIYRRHS
jgi:hypothetical protein